MGNFRTLLQNAAWTLLSCMGLWTAPEAAIAAPDLMLQSTTEDEIHATALTGFPDADKAVTGLVTIDGHGLRFHTKRGILQISDHQIQSVDIEHTTRPMVRGLAATLIKMTPYGAGQLAGAMRAGAEMVTVVYRDDAHEIHAAVLLLPTSAASAVARLSDGVVAHQNTHPSAAAPVSEPVEPGLANVSWSGPRPIRIGYPVAQADNLPAAYQAMVYEELIRRLGKSPKFTVLRDGDTAAEPNVALLETTIVKARFGNAGIRNSIPMAGMISAKTVVEAEVEYTAADGKELARAHVEGSKRTPGENIAAAGTLARRISGKVVKASAAQDQAI